MIKRISKSNRFIITPIGPQRKRQSGIACKKRAAGGDVPRVARLEVQNALIKHLIFKGPRNEILGFLRQSDGKVLGKARIDGAEKATVTLCFEDGASEALEFAPDGAEREWPARGRRAVACAYVTAQGRLLLWTDERAKRAFEAEKLRSRQGPPKTARAQRHASVEREREGAEPPAPPKPPEEEQTTGAKIEEDTQIPSPVRPDERRTARLQSAYRLRREAWRLPDRRWPPPPCMPRARYHDGEWTEESHAVTPSE